MHLICPRLALSLSRMYNVSLKLCWNQTKIEDGIAWRYSFSTRALRSEEMGPLPCVVIPDLIEDPFMMDSRLGGNDKPKHDHNSRSFLGTATVWDLSSKWTTGWQKSWKTHLTQRSRGWKEWRNHPEECRRVMSMV